MSGDENPETPVKNQLPDEVEPIWVRPRRGAKMADIGLTKFYELMNSGAIKNCKVGGMRLVSVASIKALGADEAAA